MGTFLEDLDDHDGYADRRLPNGRLADGVWTYATRKFTAYVAACGCGWQASGEHPPTEEGEEAAVDQWMVEHAEPELARQATRRHLELARVLEWLGSQADRLHDPTTVTSIARGLEQARGLLASVQRDLARSAPQGEADHGALSGRCRRSDRRIGEHGRAICQQRALPTQPGVAVSQAAVLEEWARRWRQRGPHDLPGRVELGLVEDIAAELRRLATTPTRQADPQREAGRER